MCCVPGGMRRSVHPSHCLPAAMVGGTHQGMAPAPGEMWLCTWNHGMCRAGAPSDAALLQCDDDYSSRLHLSCQLVPHHQIILILMRGCSQVEKDVLMDGKAGDQEKPLAAQSLSVPWCWRSSEVGLSQHLTPTTRMAQSGFTRPGWDSSLLGAGRKAKLPPIAKPQVLLWGWGWVAVACSGWLSSLFHTRYHRVWSH